MISKGEFKVTDEATGAVVGEIQGGYKNLPYLKDGAIVCLFDGLDNMLDYLTKKMPKAKRGKSSEKEGGGSFHTFRSYQEAMDTYRNKAESIVKFDPTEIRVRDLDEAGNNVFYDVTGDYIDMGRYMEGIPEAFGSMKSGNARNRRANITLNIVQVHFIDKEVIMHRAERVLRLVDALEGSGVRTQVTAIESSECGHTEVIIKRHDEPLTITDVAVVSHPDFLRRIIFRIVEHSKTWDWGYGSARVLSEALKPELVETDNHEELDILVDANIRSNNAVDRTFDQAEKLIAWEMSKPVPEVLSIKLDNGGVWFSVSGARAEDDIRREGNEVLNG